MARPQKTVFISYRRADISWALAVYHYLSNHNYDVFFDYKSIPSGDFEQLISGNIKARAHFLVVLTPTALDRCNEPGDWLRREIETALREKRNIIPLFFQGFNFEIPTVANKLTGELKNLRRYNGLEVPSGYFDEAMKRLQERYLNVSLDAILHPVPEEIRKAVKEHQLAADRAIAISQGKIEKVQAEGDRLIETGSVGQPTSKLAGSRSLQWLRTHAWLYVRLIALALMLSGLLGPWFQLTGCNWNPNGPTPPPQTFLGYQVMYLSSIFLANGSPSAIPAILFLITSLCVILMLAIKKMRQSKTAGWIERISAILVPVTFGGLLLQNRETVLGLLWGFYVSMSGTVLAFINGLWEWIARPKKARKMYAGTGEEFSLQSK